MKSWTKLFWLILTVFFLQSCEEKKEAPVKDSQFEAVYTLSEMALLMEEMYAVLQNERQNSFETNSEFPLFFNQIHTAEMTQDFERNEEFFAWSELFLIQTENYFANKTKENFNVVINACVACHQSNVGCFGPIVRIEKLLVKR